MTADPTMMSPMKQHTVLPKWQRISIYICRVPDPLSGAKAAPAQGLRELQCAVVLMRILINLTVPAFFRYNSL